MQNQAINLDWRDWLGLSIAILGWSLNFFAVRYTVLEMPVWTALTLRFVLVSLLLAPFLRWPKGRGKWIILATLLLVPCHFGLLFVALRLTENVGTVAIFLQIAPAFAVVLAWIFLGEVPGARRLLGLAIAIFGTVLFIFDPTLFESRTALLVASVSALAVAAYSVLLRSAGDISPFNIVGWTSVIGAPIIACIAFFVEGIDVDAVLNASSFTWATVFYTVVVSSIISHGTWAWIVKRHSIAKVMPFTLLIPFGAAFFGYVLLGETISPGSTMASLIVLAGIGLVLKARPALGRREGA